MKIFIALFILIFCAGCRNSGAGGEAGGRFPVFGTAAAPGTDAHSPAPGAAISVDNSGGGTTEVNDTKISPAGKKAKPSKGRSATKKKAGAVPAAISHADSVAGDGSGNGITHDATSPDTPPATNPKKAANPRKAAAPKKNTNKPKAIASIPGLIRPGISASGSWAVEDKLQNRLDGRFGFPAGFSLRAMLLDKRPDFFTGSLSDGKTNFSTAIYQRSTNSRALYGELEIWGLAARTTNIRAHGAPWFENHKQSGADLKTSVSSKGKNSAYFSVGTPLFRPPGLNNFGVQADLSVLTSGFDLDSSVFFAGTNFRLGKKSRLRLEGLFRRTELPAKEQKTWFSEDTFKIKRRFDFYALNMTFSSTYISLAIDFAQSAVFSSGRDIYANAALNINIKSVKFSFAADGAGKRYTGYDGNSSNSVFRVAGKFEWEGRKNSKILAAVTLLSEYYDKPFYGSSSKLQYYFPLSRGQLFSPSRIYLNFDCDARDKSKITNKYSLFFGVNTASLRPGFKLNFSEFRTAGADDAVIPWPVHNDKCEMNDAKAAFELNAPFNMLTFKGSAACVIKPGSGTGWDCALTSSIHGKHGRLSFKISYQPEENTPEYYLSYTLKTL